MTQVNHVWLYVVGGECGSTISKVILVAVILLLTSLCYLRIQTLSAWILNSSFHVLTATSMSSRHPSSKTTALVEGAGGSIPGVFVSANGSTH